MLLFLLHGAQRNPLGHLHPPRVLGILGSSTSADYQPSRRCPRPAGTLRGAHAGTAQ